jgi:hypothetical protein
VLLAAACLAAGCSHGTKRVAPAPCARARAAAEAAPATNALRGDVDGDGAIDRVSLVRLRPEARCGAVLLLRTGHRTLARPIATHAAPPVPRLNGLAALGSGRKLYIVVTTDEGASTAFAQVFSARSGRLIELAIRGPDAGGFAYLGSVTHYGGVDCVRGRPGLVEERTYSTLASSRPWLYRTFYGLRGDRFQLVRKQVIKNIPDRFSRSSGGADPFPSCMRVRAQ